MLIGLTGCSGATPYYPTPNDGLSNTPPAHIDPALQREVFFQEHNPEVDVLIVVDPDLSIHHQRVFEQMMPELLATLDSASMDFRIGVLDADATLRTVQGINLVVPGSDDPLDLLLGFATSAASSSVPNQPRDAVMSFFESQQFVPQAEQFSRNSATLELIFVSTHEDQSSIVSVNDFEQWMATFRPSTEVIAHGVVGLGSCSQGGTDVASYTQSTGGVLLDICDEDISHIPFNKDSLGLKRYFYPRYIPEPTRSEIKVRLPKGWGGTQDGDPQRTLFFVPCEDQSTPCDIEYEPRSNRFRFLEYYPPEGSEISIKYYDRASGPAERVPENYGF